MTASNDEVLSVCFRYVDKNKDIQEVFVGFVDLERITGNYTGQKIVKLYIGLGIDIRECRGQCYDGASNMQSEKVGVAAAILSLSPLAFVHHCCLHNLNLSLASTCKMSPKREVLLEMIVTLRIPDIKRRKVIVGMCKTRWSERDVAFEHFYLAIPFIAEALEIMNGTHPDLPSFDAIYTKGSEATKNEASANLKAVTSFEFLIGLIGIYRFLHPLTGITTRLQGRSMDIVRGFQDVKSCIDDLKDIRNDIDTNFAIV